jgi:hypothetical protein
MPASNIRSVRALPLLVGLLAAGSAALVGAACGLDANGIGGGAGIGAIDGGGADADVPIGDAGGAVGVDANTGPTGVDANTGDANTGDTGAGPGPDASSGAVDAGSGGSDGCATTEICDNGVDDNCNGLVDCADPACQSGGWTCTPAAIPSGWTLAEYAEMDRPACSSGYGSPSDVLEGPDGQAADCQCACTVATAGTCESGSFSVTSNVATPMCGGVPVTSAANSGACSPAAVDFTAHAGSMLQITPVAYTAGSCTPAPSGTPPPVEFAGQGRVCTDGNSAGRGCPSSGVCAPAAQGSFGLCIVASGTVSCPAGFTHAHTVGSSVNDDRGCTACTCGGATAQCANASLTLYTAADCSAGAASVAATNMCLALPAGAGGNATYVAYEYTAAVQAESCPPSPVSAKGGVSLAGVHTVCCQ